MSSFRSPQTILRRGPGQYVLSRWVEGVDLPPITIMASVQPATAGDYDLLIASQAGRRIEKVVRIYTGSLLNVAGADDKNGDRLVWEGSQYLIIGVSQWRSTSLAHYRYLASKELEP